MDIPALPICKISLTAQKLQNKGYPSTLVTIGDHIRKRRLDFNLFQKDVAKLLGVDEYTITNWEKNRTQPTLSLLPKVIQFLGYISLEIKVDSLGDRIKLYRKVRGVSQKILAKEIGIDACTLARWEKNKRNLKTSFLNLIQNFFSHKKTLFELSKIKILIDFILNESMLNVVY